MKHILEYFHNCPHCGSVRFEINNEKSKLCADCGFCYFLNPSAAVAAFILNEKGELLVCVRAKEPQKGTLDFPGGFVDCNETAEQTVAREIKEELNLDVEDIRYQFSLPNVYRYSGLDIPTLDLFFMCTVSDFSSLKVADDVSEARFVAVDKLNPAEFGLDSMRRAVGILKTFNK
jgi:ADP-ribose pyrophosphatase YjhB (NUDIX family)